MADNQAPPVVTSAAPWQFRMVDRGSGTLYAPVSVIDIGGESNESLLVRGQQTKANSLPVGIASDQMGSAGTPASQVMTVQGITSGQPVIVSQTTAANLNCTVVGTGTFAAQVSGSVTANAGTNLNTALLALESGGNLATISTNTGKIPSQGQALAASSLPVVLPAAQITTLTPPNTVAVTQSTASSLNATIVGTGTFAVQAAQSGNWTSRLVGNAGATLDAAGQNATSPANSLLVGAQFNTTPTTITTGNMSPLQIDNAGNLLVNIKAGSSSGAVAQGSTTSGQTGGLTQGAVTTSSPSYTNAQTSPLSLDTSGNLRVNVVTGGTSGVVAQGSTTSGQTGMLIQGAVTTGSPSYTNAQTSPISLDTSGNVRVNVVAGGAGGGIVTQATASNLNATVVGTGTFAVQAAQSGTWNMRNQDGSGNAISSTGGAMNVALLADASPSTQNITAADAASTTATWANSQSAVSGAPTANSAASFAISGIDTVNIQVTGTFNATLVTEISVDGGTNWFARGVHQIGSSYTASTFTGSGVTANFAGLMNVAGATNVRVRCTSYTSGTATALVVKSLQPSATYLANTARISDPTTPTQQWAISSAGAGASNLTQVAGASIATGHGTASGAIRVELPTDGTGLVTVSQATAASLNCTVVGTGTFATQAACAGDVASGSSDSGNPVKQGFRATTALSAITTVTDGQRVNGAADISGVQIVRPNSGLEDIVGGTGNATGTSNTSVVAAQGAGVRFYCTDLCISNTSATAVEVNIIDDVGGANTVLWGPFPVPANTSGVVKQFGTPLRFSANKAAGFASLTGVTTIKVSFNGFKAKV